MSLAQDAWGVAFVGNSQSAGHRDLGNRVPMNSR